MINKSLFEEIRNSKSKVLVVTKYWDSKITDKIVKKLTHKYGDIIYWFWENRIEDLILKNINRENMHFIWNIQSKKIEKIVTFCWTIHSLEKLKHAKLIDEHSKKFQVKTKVFLQINLDPTKPSGLTEIELSTLIKDMENLENVEILWISWIWAWIFTQKEKQEEFDFLKRLRDTYLPWKLISAWTSRDYKFALKNEIEVLRIGRKILED